MGDRPDALPRPRPGPGQSERDGRARAARGRPARSSIRSSACGPGCASPRAVSSASRFTTGVAAGEPAARACAQKYHDHGVAARAFALAYTQAQVAQRHLGVSVEQAQLSERLASRVFFSDALAARRRRDAREQHARSGRALALRRLGRPADRPRARPGAGRPGARPRGAHRPRALAPEGALGGRRDPQRARGGLPRGAPRSSSRCSSTAARGAPGRGRPGGVFLLRGRRDCRRPSGSC